MMRVRPDIADLWILHHDNAPSHTSLLENLAKKDISVLPHLPYSPDLAPCDFFFISEDENQEEWLLSLLQSRERPEDCKRFSTT